MRLLFFLCLFFGISHGENLFSKIDLSLTRALEGDNHSALLDISMESIALSTPFIEFGYTGILQLQSEKMHSLTASTLGVQLPIALGKYVIQKDRPRRQYKPRLWNSRWTSSFPSGHGATTAAWATTMVLSFPQMKSMMIGYTLVSGYSQVYVGNHYISDVIAGWLLGWVTATLLHRSFETNQTNSMNTPFFRVTIPLQ